MAMAHQLTSRGVGTLIDTYDSAVPPNTRGPGVIGTYSQKGDGTCRVRLFDTGRVYIRRLLNVQFQQSRTRDGSPTWWEDMGANEYTPNGPERLDALPPAAPPSRATGSEEERSRSRQTERRSASQPRGRRETRDTSYRYTNRQTGQQVHPLTHVGNLRGVRWGPLLLGCRAPILAAVEHAPGCGQLLQKGKRLQGICG